eukprot:7751-Heterococcus_DN1.PRE.3
MDVEIEGAVLEQRNKHAEVVRCDVCQNCINDNENLSMAFVAGLASGCAGIMVGQNEHATI